jgi:hypothetical protein
MHAPQQGQSHQVNLALPPPPPPPPVQVYHNLPANLAAQMADLPAMPPMLRQPAIINNPAPFPMPPPIEPPAPPLSPPPVEPEELLPPPENIGALPEARQLFDPNWPVHFLEKMDVVCSSCQALHWMDERLVRSTK